MAIQELSKTEIDVVAGGATFSVGGILGGIVSAIASFAGTAVKLISGMLGSIIGGIIPF